MCPYVSVDPMVLELAEKSGWQIGHQKVAAWLPGDMLGTWRDQARRFERDCVPE